MKRGTPNHRKMHRLARCLRVSLAEAVGTMELLWHWVADYLPRGDIGKSENWEIAAAVQDMILVELYTDGTDTASEENQQLQEKTFNTVAIPYYALMDGDGKVVASFPGLTRKAEEFLAFLKTRPQSL